MIPAPSGICFSKTGRNAGGFSGREANLVWWRRHDDVVPITHTTPCGNGVGMSGDTGAAGITLPLLLPNCLYPDPLSEYSTCYLSTMARSLYCFPYRVTALVPIFTCFSSTENKLVPLLTIHQFACQFAFRGRTPPQMWRPSSKVPLPHITPHITLVGSKRGVTTSGY